MNDISIALIFVLLGLTIIGLIVLSIFLYKLSKKPSQEIKTVDNSESFGQVKEKIDNVEKSMEKSMKLVMADEMVKMQKSYGENTAKSMQNLNEFQTKMAESMQKQIDSLNKRLEDKMAALDKKVDDKLAEGFKSTNESMTQVRERLKTIDEAQKQMEGLGKEMVSIKNVLEGNQTRGQYGEYQLDMILNSIFGDAPNCYELQYTMKKVKDGDDVRADAVVFMPEPNKLIAVDSKFPFSHYAQLFDTEDEALKESLKSEFSADVKKHITAIKNKYIVPDKTAPEAFMFIPNDGVFAFIHHDLPEVVDYARTQRVIICSPSTLPPMLFTINMLRIDAERSKNAKIISEQLNKLGKDFEMFGREWDQLSDRLDKVSSTKDQLNKRVGKISNKFNSISSSSDIPEIEGNEFERITIHDED